MQLFNQTYLLLFSIFGEGASGGAAEEHAPDMEGGDAAAPPTAAMGKMSLDHSKRVYPQQAYTGTEAERERERRDENS